MRWEKELESTIVAARILGYRIEAYHTRVEFLKEKIEWFVVFFEGINKWGVYNKHMGIEGVYKGESYV